MEIRSSRFLQIVYCLTLAGIIFPTGLVSSSSWIGLFFGGGLFGFVPFLPFVLLILFGWRIITVVRNPAALDVYAPGIVSRAVRFFGIFLICIGLTSMIGMFFIKPITLALFRTAGENGIGYFAVGIYLVFLAGAGIIGVIIFEVIRILGSFSRKSIPSDSPARVSLSEEGKVKRKTSPLTAAFITLVVLAALGFFLYSNINSILFNAITFNNTERAKTIINLGIGVNSKSGKGFTILHHAASYGNAEVVKLLIKKGADVNAQTVDGSTPLHIAVTGRFGMGGSAEAVKALIAGGAKVNTQTVDGSTPLHMAAGGGFGVKAEGNMLEAAKILLANGADVNMKTKDGDTPLHKAARKNNLQMAQLLITNGADVNIQNNQGYTPLGYASLSKDNSEVAEFLAARGAGLKRADFPKLLRDAALSGNTKSIEFLISKGADPNAKSDDEMFALYFAASSDYHADAVEALLKKGADPNERNRYGYTALHQAASQGAIKVAEILIKHGADVNARGKEGYTPLHGAVHFGDRKTKNISALLIRKGANVNARTDRHGETPLNWAIFNGDIDDVNMLISNGAVVKEVCGRGIKTLVITKNAEAIRNILQSRCTP